MRSYLENSYDTAKNLFDLTNQKISDFNNVIKKYDFLSLPVAEANFGCPYYCQSVYDLCMKLSADNEGCAYVQKECIENCDWHGFNDILDFDAW